MKSEISIFFILFFTFCFNLEGQAPYCASGASSDGMSDITNVTIKQGATIIFTNTSTCGQLAPGSGSIAGRYANYRNQVINLTKGTAYTLEVTHSDCSSTFNINTRQLMYLDLNRNFVFDTPSERLIWTGVQMVNIGSSATFTSSFSIPSNITVDTTVMRIITYAIAGGDANQCRTNYGFGETEDYTVSFCEPVIRNRTITQPLCQGQTNGKIKVVASGGRAPLQYAWNGGSYGSIDSLPNIGAGIYTLITRDSIGCKHYDTILVSQPSILALNKQLDSSCQNANTGRISLQGIGGKPSYRYRLGNSGAYDTTKQWIGLGMGSYIVSVRDTNLCVKTDTLRIDSFPSYPLFKQIDTIVCRSKLGAIWLRFNDLNVTTAHTHYSYNGGVFLPTVAGQYYSGFTLDSGRHIIVMRDKHGCLTADTTNFSAPPPTKLSLIGMNHLGCNGKKGYIQVLRTGGNPALTYSYYWSHIGSTTWKDSFQNLDTGLYTIQVRDDRGCDTTQIKVRINNISARVTPSYQMLSQFKCATDTQHIVKISASGGAAPYQYSLFSLDYPDWSYNFYPFPPYGQKDTLHVSSANAYKTLHIYVKVRDTNQCENDTFFLIRPESICHAYATAQPNPACAGDTIEVRMSYNPGEEQYIKAPVRYSVQGLPFTTNKTLKPVKTIQGPNLVTIQHGQGCVDYIDVFINTNPAVTINTSLTHPSCIGQSNGSISSFPISGTSPFVYTLNGGAGQSTPIFNGLAAGSYTVQVVDDNGCKSSQQVVLNSLNYQLNAELLQPVSCKNQADGSLRVTLSGANIQSGVLYSINGSNPSAQNTWSGLAAGSYTIRMTYNTSCSYDTTIILTEPSLLRANYIANQIALPCFGSQLGSIQLAPSGGSPSYNLSVNGTARPIQTLNGLGAGSYFLELRDSRGCIDTQTFIFSTPERLRIDTTLVIQPSCAGGNDGQINLSTRGGTQPHVVLWSTGESSLARSGLNAGVYSIRVSDANLCKDSIQIVLKEPSTIVLESRATMISCYGYKDGRIDIQTSGGTMPHSYLWDDAVNTPNRINLDTGTYSLEIKDSKNCVRTEKFDITQPSRITSQIKVKDASCPNTTDGSVRFSPSGGIITPSLDYRIRLNNSAISQQRIYEGLAPSLYTFKILDSRDCYLDTQARISAPDLVTIKLDTVHQLSKFGEAITLYPSVEPSSAFVSLTWLPSIGLSCTDCLNPSFNGFTTQRYTLVYRYENGLCGDSVKTIIRAPLADPTTIYIPTAFSPNGEGDIENETFKVYGHHILRVDMRVFNRWGEKVFESDNKLLGWDGTYKGEPAPKGLYSYSLNLTLLDGTKLVKSGEIMLVR